MSKRARSATLQTGFVKCLLMQRSHSEGKVRASYQSKPVRSGSGTEYAIQIGFEFVWHNSTNLVGHGRKKNSSHKAIMVGELAVHDGQYIVSKHHHHLQIH